MVTDSISVEPEKIFFPTQKTIGGADSVIFEAL